MNELLINTIEERRQEAGCNGHPLSYQKFAQAISGQLHGASLFRFVKGEAELRVSSLRLIAAWARANNDQTMLRAIAVYALGLDVLVAPVDN